MTQAGTTINQREPEASGSGGHGPILVIEADAEFGRATVEQLAADGHSTQLALTAGHAGVLAANHPPRLIVLGELDTTRESLDLLEDIRRNGHQVGHERPTCPWSSGLPVIVLSSRTGQPDLLRAFDAGADDFVPRSTGYLELRARLRALLRRSASGQSAGPLRVGPLTINPAAHAASIHGNPLKLRRLEYELLLHLAGEPRRVFTKHELLKAVWSYPTQVCTRTLDSHASRLRRKLRAEGGEQWVVNVRGVGYRLI